MVLLVEQKKEVKNCVKKMIAIMDIVISVRPHSHVTLFGKWMLKEMVLVYAKTLFPV